MITRINTDAVTGSITYAPSEATSGNVTATISFNKEEVTVTNNEGNTGYTFTANGSFTYEFVDSYGNTGSETATVDWIDKTAPTATSVSYSPDGNTNQPVEVTLVIDENVQEIVGWTGSGTTWRKTYAENTTETVIFYDLVGNV